MKLETLAGAVGPLGHSDRILLLGWFLHAHDGKLTFMPADIGKCYDRLHLALPTGSLGPYFASLSKKGGQLLKNTQGYRLEGSSRALMENKYAQAKTAVEISALLADLPAKLPTLAERTYLDEALICYSNNAHRAAIVMTWNLAYAHLCDYVVKNRLAEFNARWQQDHKGDHKNGVRTIKVVSDFADEELGEAKVLKTCLNAGIIVKNVYNVLEPALKKRNAAAHPNDVSIKQVHVDSFIDDVVTNAILKLAS